MSQQALYSDLIDIVRRDRQRRSRGKRFGAAMGKLLVALIQGFLLALSSGFMFMLAVGVVHHEWLPALPTLGYWWAVLISYLIRSGLNIHTPPSKREQAS